MEAHSYVSLQTSTTASPTSTDYSSTTTTTTGTTTGILSEDVNHSERRLYIIYIIVLVAHFSCVKSSTTTQDVSSRMNWHCGDEANNIPPMKYFTKLDVDYLGKGASTRLYELRKLMNMVDKAAAESGHTPKQYMSLAEANTCFFHGEKAILDIVPANTPQGRARVVAMMKWTTVVKYTHKKRGGETE